jgi:hypothetical protein
VGLDTEAATACVREVRGRIRSPALEYKANHLLREKHRAVLIWLLGPSGPLRGNAHVFLVDKAFFIVSRVVELLAGEHAGAMAATLYRDGRESFGGERWDAFLIASNNLMRANGRLDVSASAGSFFRVVDGLRGTVPGDPVGEALTLLAQARSRADAFRELLLGDPRMIPALDPLIPAIVRAVAHWGGGEMPVSIVHDQQNTLTADRVAQLQRLTGDPAHALVSLRLVDSRSDARVQVADFLAGVARKIASDELGDRGDPELTALLRPYVDASSIWGDGPSWSRLQRSGPGDDTRR